MTARISAAARLARELEAHRDEVVAQVEELAVANARLASAAERSARLLEIAPTALFVLGADRRIAEVNERAIELTGLQRRRLYGPFENLFVAEAREGVIGFLRNTGSRTRREHRAALWCSGLRTRPVTLAAVACRPRGGPVEILVAATPADAPRARRDPVESNGAVDVSSVATAVVALAGADVRLDLAAQAAFVRVDVADLARTLLDLLRWTPRPAYVRTTVRPDRVRIDVFDAQEAAPRSVVLPHAPRAFAVIAGCADDVRRRIVRASIEQGFAAVLVADADEADRVIDPLGSRAAFLVVDGDVDRKHALPVLAFASSEARARAIRADVVLVPPFHPTRVAAALAALR